MTAIPRHKAPEYDFPKNLQSKLDVRWHEYKNVISSSVGPGEESVTSRRGPMVVFTLTVSKLSSSRSLSRLVMVSDRFVKGKSLSLGVAAQLAGRSSAPSFATYLPSRLQYLTSREARAELQFFSTSDLLLFSSI